MRDSGPAVVLLGALCVVALVAHTLTDPVRRTARRRLALAGGVGIVALVALVAARFAVLA